MVTKSSRSSKSSNIWEPPSCRNGRVLVYLPTNLAQLTDFKVTFPKWKKSGNLRKNFNRIGDEGIDLLSKMLTYDPSKRVTAQVALLHPYFKDIREEDVMRYSYFE